MESLTITKWRRHFHANEVIADVRASFIWLRCIIIVMNVKSSFIMSMTLKTTKNMCCGLSVVFRITTRRSTIDVRKKSDISRKNRSTGSSRHVRKIWDWPQSDMGERPLQYRQWPPAAVMKASKFPCTFMFNLGSNKLGIYKGRYINGIIFQHLVYCCCANNTSKHRAISMSHIYAIIL